MSERVRVKQLFTDLDLEQKAVAEEIDVDHTHLCHVLSGRRPFSRTMARKLSAYFKEKHDIEVNAGALVLEEPVSAHS